MDLDLALEELREAAERFEAAVSRLQPITVEVRALGWRHDPTDECDGRASGPWCPECYRDLCGCERGYGHDCEDEG